MEKSDVLKIVNEVFIETLDNKDIVLNYDTTAKDVEDWNSLNHVQLVVAIEKQFKIRFTSKEFYSWKNVGEMLDSIVAKS